MAWALWLGAPALVGALAAGWAWWRARPQAVPGTAAAIRAHDEYLDALTRPVRGASRVTREEP